MPQKVLTEAQRRRKNELQKIRRNLDNNSKHNADQRERYAKQKKDKYDAMSPEEKDKFNAKRRMTSEDITEHKKKLLRIQNWKRKGILIHDIDTFYDMYVNTWNCQLCNIKMTEDKRNTSTTRCLDHDHISGYWRFIVCHTCNTKQKPRDGLHLRLMLEIHRYSNR